MAKRTTDSVSHPPAPLAEPPPAPSASSAPSSHSDSGEQLDEREQRLFRSLSVDGNDFVTRRDLLHALQRIGLLLDDARLRDCMSALQAFEDTTAIHYADFCRIVRPNILLVERALQGNMVVADFKDFCQDLEKIFNEVKEIRGGDVARYIPQLARVNPEHFAVAVCTVDGSATASVMRAPSSVCRAAVSRSTTVWDLSSTAKKRSTSTSAVSRAACPSMSSSSTKMVGRTTP